MAARDAETEPVPLDEIGRKIIAELTRVGRMGEGVLSSHPEVHHVALVGGDFDVILLVRAVDNIDLRRVIFDQLQSMPGVLDTQTFLVFEDLDTR